MTPTFKQAAGFRMPLGKYRGKTLDQIAESDEGLRYLDWLSGQEWLRAELLLMLVVYLGDPVIKREVDRIVEEEMHGNG